MRGCSTVILCTALLLVGLRPAAAQDVFAGTWQIVDAQPAPWVGQPDSAAPYFDEAMKQGKITIAPDHIAGPPPLDCTKAQYELNEVGPDYLFEGGLTDPAPQAAVLGFTGDKIMLLRMGCVRDDADISMDFAMIDDNTAMFALNNVIYRMVRTTAPQ